MADSKKKSLKPGELSIGQRATNLGLGIAGGAAGNQITSFLEKQTWLPTTMVPHAATATALLGGAIYIFAPKEVTSTNEMIRSFGFGMAVASGTEEAEGLFGMISGAMGMSNDKQLGLGKSHRGHLGMDTSKAGEQDKVIYVGNVAVN